MKKLFPTLVLFVLFLSSCSKCYECIDYHKITDVQGNVIDSAQVNESICTSDQDEIRRRESSGWVCT